MNEKIMKFSSQLLYDNKLQADDSVIKHQLKDFDYIHNEYIDDDDDDYDDYDDYESCILTPLIMIDTEG